MAEYKEKATVEGTRETQLWKDYQNARAYQSSIGLTSKLPLYVRFYEGDQWAKPTKRTQNLPRPVINIVKMICRNKKSAILSTAVRLVYESENDKVDVDKFNHFASYIQKELGQEALDKKAIGSGVKKGSYFYHYYWDSEARGKDGKAQIEGALRCELIDPLNIFFSDPCETDEQKQKWIMIASRESVDSVRAKCDRDVDPDMIGEDTSDDPYASKEQEGSKLVTVLTRYFRHNGEVYIEKGTRKSVINKPFPLTPNMESARAALEGVADAPNNSLPDKDSGAELRPVGVRAWLYPIVVGNYEERDKCIYGLGEIEGLIQNQRSINFNIAMMLLASQENGWGKYVVAKDALQGQAITNEPGQVIVDYSKAGNGIKRLSDVNLPSSPMSIVETLTQMTRSVTGSSEVMTGETIGANMSGAAIAQLQSQAQMPVEDLRESFWMVKEKQGRILAQFFKLFYEDKEFSFAPEEARQEGERGEYKHEHFNSSEFALADFDVVVEAVGGTKASVAGDISALDTALSNGGISLLTYFKLYPKDALSNRSEIIKFLSTQEANQTMILQTQIQQLTEQLAQKDRMLSEQAKAVDKVDSIISENQSLKITLARLYDEANTKIRFANEQITAGNAKLLELQGDATQMARHIAAAQGLPLMQDQMA